MKPNNIYNMLMSILAAAAISAGCTAEPNPTYTPPAEEERLCEGGKLSAVTLSSCSDHATAIFALSAYFTRFRRSGPLSKKAHNSTPLIL